MDFLGFLRLHRGRGKARSGREPRVGLRSGERDPAISLDGTDHNQRPAPTTVENCSGRTPTATNRSATKQQTVPTVQSENLVPTRLETAGRTRTVPTAKGTPEPSVPTGVLELEPPPTGVPTVSIDEFDRQVLGLHKHLNELKRQILARVLSRIDDHEEKVMEQFQQLPLEIQKTSTKLFQQLKHFLPHVPPETRDVLESLRNLSEGHKRIVNLFLTPDMTDEVLSYQDIGLRLGLAPVTVRGYVADLRRLGFPLRERRVGRKLLIGIQRRALRQILERPDTQESDSQS